MPKCDHCGIQCQLPFHCTYCGGSFCSEHRLPPSHNCINESAWRERKYGVGSDVKSKEANPSLNLKECFFCGVKTSKIFYCPLCGHDFCSVHKHHEDHYIDSHRTEKQKFDHSAPSTNPSGGSDNHPYIMVFLVIIAFIVGIFFAGGFFSQGSSSGSTGTQIQQYISTATPYPTITLLPTTTRIVYPRPMSGAIVSGNRMSGGNGDLTIDNIQGGSDAIAVLTNYGFKNTLTAVYIRSGEIFKIENIPDGTYEIFIQYGGNWNPGERKFEDYPRYARFEDPFRYTTTETTRETDTHIYTDTKYTTWEITLYKVVDGNADTEVLPEERFPEL